MVSSVDHVNTPDPYTVEICFNVLSNYGVCLIGDLPIVPKHIWENVPPDESVDYDPEEHDALIGTGPFRFFKDGVLVELTACQESLCTWNLTLIASGDLSDLTSLQLDDQYRITTEELTKMTSWPQYVTSAAPIRGRIRKLTHMPTPTKTAKSTSTT